MAVTQVIESEDTNVIAIHNNNINYGGTGLLLPTIDSDISWITDPDHCWATALSLESYLNWHRIGLDQSSQFNMHFDAMPEYSNGNQLSSSVMSDLIDDLSDTPENGFVNDFILSDWRYASIGGRVNEEGKVPYLYKTLFIIDPNTCWNNSNHYSKIGNESLSNLTISQLLCGARLFVQGEYVIDADEDSVTSYPSLTDNINNLTSVISQCISDYSKGSLKNQLKCYGWDSSIDLDINRKVISSEENIEVNRLIAQGKYAEMGDENIEVNKIEIYNLTENLVKPGDLLSIKLAIDFQSITIYKSILVIVPSENDYVDSSVYVSLGPSLIYDINVEVDSHSIYAYYIDEGKVMVRIHSLNLINQ